MKRYNSLYYFLIVLLIMGGFASMAQNNYGLKILGAVSLIFGLLFLLQLVYQVRKTSDRKQGTIVELSALCLLSILFPLRLFHISIPYLEWMIVATGGILAIVYLFRMIHRFQQYRAPNKFLAGLLLFYHASITFFILAISTISLLPVLAVYTAIAALLCLVLFLMGTLLKKQLQVDGENVSVLSVIAHFKDQSLLLISLFFIFSLYFILTSASILPRLYSDEYPQAYFELVNKAETGKDKPAHAKNIPEEFKEKYDQFVARNISKK